MSTTATYSVVRHDLRALRGRRHRGGRLARRGQRRRRRTQPRRGVPGDRDQRRCRCRWSPCGTRSTRPATALIGCNSTGRGPAPSRARVLAFEGGACHDRNRAIDLQIGGMTCASCAARIEKKLNRMRRGAGQRQLRHREGARRCCRPGTTPQAAIATVEATGYTARLPAPPAARAGTHPARRRRDRTRTAEVASLRQRLLISPALTLPVLVLAMVAPVQFDNWQWLSAHPGRAGGGVGGVAVPPGRLDRTCGTAPRPWTP